MRTNKTNIDIDGDRFNFYFEKSGAHKGAGLTGEKDDKFYQSGKLITAGKDEKYQVVKTLDPTIDVINDTTVGQLRDLGVNKKAEDIKELYIIDTTQVNANDYFVVNTSGKVIDTKSKNKDGNDYYYVIKKGGQIAAIYAEN